MLVQSQADIDAALAFIAQHEVLAYDTETTGLNPRSDRVIGFGVSTAHDGFYFPIWVYNAALGELEATGLDPSSVLAALAQKKLLMFNASFDARFTKFNLGVDLVPALACDVLLLKHTCDEEFPFGLKEIATKVFGADAKAEKLAMQASIKANGGTATEYYKADLGLMATYCIQDCRLTYRLFNHYSADLERQGLHRFFYEDEVMPLYREVTIPMEERGVRLDIPKLQEALSEICADLQALEAEIQAAIAPHLALFERWFLNKDFPASRSGTFAQGIAQLYALPLPRTSAGKFQLTEKSLSALPESQPKAVLQKFQPVESIDVESVQRLLWGQLGQPYMFNLLSKHHLKKLFFEILGETPTSTTELGNPQVDEDFLRSVSSKYAWVPQLIDYNKLVKIKGTYIERLLNESAEGRFYPSFQQHRTVSGRYAGDLQQLPRPLADGAASGLVIKHNNRIREFIVPDDACLLMSADYESLEPHIFAHTSGDTHLQQIFTSGLDFYSEVAIRTEGLRGVSSEKSAPDYLGAVNKAARQKAKAYALGIAYGMTGFKLKFEINVDSVSADQLVKDYLASFPGLAAWMDASRAQVLSTGRIATQAGRIRHMPAAPAIYRKYGSAILDDLELWKQFNARPEAYRAAKADRKVLKNLLNNAINFQVQGLAASIVNRAAIVLSRRLKAQGLSAAIVMQVHDELVLNVPEHERAHVAGLVKHAMETVVQLSVPLKTEPQCGTNFRECK